jgi:glycosyltransferase involved in cell wall biosynthesis
MTVAISIIIAHLNQEAFLERCLVALEGQIPRRRDVEVIVVDNGSRQLPAALCDRYGAQLATESDPGPGPARNRGVILSSGQILAFIDADCRADSGWLAAISRAFSLSGTQIVGGDVRIDVVDQQNLTPLEAYESVFAYRQKEYIQQQGFSGTGNLAMRRDIHAAVGPFAGIGVAEDRDWGLRATAKGYHIGFVPDMVVFHPARDTLEQLYKKWDRQISHQFEETARSPFGKIVWLGKALAIVASSVIDIRKIVRSRRIDGFQSRKKAASVLFRIRLYRARLMFAALFDNGTQTASTLWNRPDSNS